MYNVLVVDDEPLICKGLQSLLHQAGLDIGNVFAATGGAEALDYVKLEDIDLIVTDIQMGAMSGIDLMYQAKIMKPWIQTIVISAHDTFQYAQQAIRLGAKDYIVKPINNAHLLDSVRNALLRMEKAPREDQEYLERLSERFELKEPERESEALLHRLIGGGGDGGSAAGANAAERGSAERSSAERGSTRSGSAGSSAADRSAVAAELLRCGVALDGPYYAVLRMRLDAAQAQKQPERGLLTERDVALLRYAALNIASECMNGQWRSTAFYSGAAEITAIVQWTEAAYAEAGNNKIERLEMLGRSVHETVSDYLRVACCVGISQIMKGDGFLPELFAQAGKAISLNKQHHDNFVFYYGNLNWNVHDGEPTADDIYEQNNTIVEKVKAYIHDHYRQKGLTLHEVAQHNHVSPNYLSYLFKKFTGFNLWEYVIKLRMEESKRLIMTTDMRRYEIADEVGYESPEHFSKIFKKYYGISPSEMKK